MNTHPLHRSNLLHDTRHVVIVARLRCPACGSTKIGALTSRRVDYGRERTTRCRHCDTRFIVAEENAECEAEDLGVYNGKRWLRIATSDHELAVLTVGVPTDEKPEPE